MVDIEKINSDMYDIIKSLMSSNSLEEKDYSDFIDLDYIDLIIRRSLSKEFMQENGCFFTGEKLANKLLNESDISEGDDIVFLDPTCGLGNLLIKASKHLPIKDSLKETLEVWGRKLVGFDIFSEFVLGAKLRIILEAIRRGALYDCSIELSINLLYRITQKNVMSVDKSDIEDITHVLLNPPFSYWDAPGNELWKKGKVNSAGVILDHIVRILPQNTTIKAILPDVLRSGSRYKNLRNHLSENISGEINVWGKFSSKTDVDVFILDGRKDYERPLNWHIHDTIESTLSEYFDISIGPLVAYREPEVGENVLYLHQKNSPSGEIITEISEKRCFRGRLTNPPFIVVKRTSSPRDKIRAAATVVNCGEPVAVENHLIIISPKDRSLERCLELLGILSSQNTTDYLNSRIRLRHLTVSAIKSIPYI